MAAAAGVTFGLSATSAATLLLLENFDGYADQAAFNAAWPATVGTGGTLSGARSVSAPNSVNFPLTAQRNDRSFGEAGLPDVLNVVRFSFDFFDSNAAATPYREFSQLIDGAGTSSGQLVSMGLNNNLTSAADGGNYYMARILGGDGGTGVSAFFKLNLGGPATLRSTGWHNLAVEITNASFNFFVDGILSESVTNSLTLRSYDIVRLGSGLSSVNDANFDNVSVELNPTPEPSTAALCLLGAGALLGRRRRASSGRPQLPTAVR